MKNKFKLYGIIVLVAIIGLGMASCDVGTSPLGSEVPGKAAPPPSAGFVIYDSANGGWKVNGVTLAAIENGGLVGISDNVPNPNNVYFRNIIIPSAISLTGFTKLIVTGSQSAIYWVEYDTAGDGNTGSNNGWTRDGNKATLNLATAGLTTLGGASPFAIILQGNAAGVKILKIELE